MIALDTNVLVRFLVEDDAAQSARAARLIERAIKSESTTAPGSSPRRALRPPVAKPISASKSTSSTC